MTDHFRLVLAWVLLMLYASLLPASLHAAQDGATYSFGVVPQFEARERAGTWLPILAELSKRSGLKLELKGSMRIPDFDAEFNSGAFDFAYLNPFHAHRAIRENGYHALVRDAGNALYGILAVRKDSHYHSINDLAGQRIAFPSPNAIGASLLVRADLESLHKISYTPVYVQTHASAYLNAILGTTAAVGGVQSTFDLQKPEVRDQLRILYQTRKIPPHPVIAHPRVPEAHRLKLQQAFLELAATPEGARLLSRIPMKQAIAASAADYDIIATLNLEKLSQKDGK
ncbi:MAG: phosphate/phosphite/phosphonate ABC transporter substrate-binding protein [Pseudomonadota bacterium]